MQSIHRSRVVAALAALLILAACNAPAPTVVDAPDAIIPSQTEAPIPSGTGEETGPGTVGSEDVEGSDSTNEQQAGIGTLGSGN